MRNPKVDDFVSAMLHQQVLALQNQFQSDVINIKSPIRFGLDDAVRHEIENLEPAPGQQRPERLTAIIETTGGSIEVVERIYNVFRKHYKIVDFIVPNYAYSAGTVLALSGDEIYMDYYSILGPIDPQYDENGKFMPGIGYLQKFNELVGVVNKAKSADKVRAELAYLLKKFDPAMLFFLEQAKSHSESLLEDWLPRHKFKDWNQHKNGKKVTAAQKRKRAKEIALVLGNPEKWHSHGRGIGIRELTSNEIKLQIKNFGEDAALNGIIRPYYDLFTDYCGKLGAGGYNSVVLHSRNGIRRLT